MRIETHLHTGGITYCALIEPAKIPALYKKAGYDILISTDHYNSFVLRNQNAVELLLQNFYTLREEANRLGMQAYFGIEIQLEQYNVERMPSVEVLVYGAKLEEVVKTIPNLHKLSQEELFLLAEKHDLLVYQAHPFRNYATRANPEFLHGVEVVNANPRHESQNGCALDFAKEHKKLMLSGGDFHQIGDEGRAGIETNENIASYEDLIRVLKSNSYTLIS